MNSTLPEVNLSVTGNLIGNYLPSNNVVVNIHPPNGAWLNAWMNWNIEQSSSSSYANGNSTTTVSQTLSNMSDGYVWVNVTVGDAYGRIQTQTWRYTIDGSVGTQPTLSLSGSTTTVNGTMWVSPTTVLVLSNLSDDPSGIGYSRSECRNGSGTWSTVTSTTFSLTSVSGQEVAYSVECRIVDQLGNRGNSTWSNGTVDARSPTISTILQYGDVISYNNSIGYSCVDSVGASTTHVVYSHQNSTNVRNGVVWLNGSQPSLVQMNLLNAGNLALDYWCVDNLGNLGHLNLTGLYYTEISPSSSITISSDYIYQNTAGLLFVSSNISVSIDSIANNHANIQLNISLNRGNITLFSMNSTNSTVITLSNYSDGVYMVIVQACSGTLCSINRVIYNKDTTGPSGTLQLTLSNGTSFVPNSNLNIGMQQRFQLSGTVDQVSGVSRIACNIGNNNYTFTINNNTWLQPSSLNQSLNGSSITMYCSSYDRLNNPSIEYQFNLSFELVAPELTLSLNNFGTYVFQETLITAMCNDDSNIDSFNFEYQLNNGSLQSVSIQHNWTGTLGSLIGSISNSSTITFRIICTDSYSNSNSTNFLIYSLIPNLGQVTFNLRNGTTVGTNYALGNGSEIFISSDYPIGFVNVSAILNGTIIWSTNLNTSSNMRIDSSDINDIFNGQPTGALISISATQIVSVSNLNTTINFGTFILYDAPYVSSLSRTVLSNGSTTEILLANRPCGYTNINYNFAGSLATRNISSSMFNISMPQGTSSAELLYLDISDCLGNNRSETYNITRDITSPSIQINGLNLGVYSPEESLIVNITDNYGIAWLEIRLSNYSSESVICSTSNVCSIQLLATNGFPHNQLGYLRVQGRTNSGEVINQNHTFYIDSEMDSPIIDVNNSANLSGYNISHLTTVVFTTNEFAQQICLDIVGVSIGDFCMANGSIINWTPVPNQNITFVSIFINATDRYGNSVSTPFTFTNVQATPILLQNRYISDSVGWIEINVSHSIPFTIDFSGSINQFSQNSSINIQVSGVHNLSYLILDQVGNQASGYILFVVDDTAPNLNLSVNSNIFVGADSVISLNINDGESYVSNLGITISNATVNCSISLTTNSNSIVFNTSFNSIIGMPSCQISSSDSQVLVISTFVTNEVGRISALSKNVTYVGALRDVHITGTNYTVNSNGWLQVSNFSELECTSSHPVTFTASLLSFGGVVNNLSNSKVRWVQGNGSIMCSVEDVLGNSLNRSWPVYYHENDLIVSALVVNGTSNISRSGAGNLEINWLSAHPINSIELYLNGTYFSTLNDNATISIGAGYGNQNVTIIATSVLGFNTEIQTNVILDNQPPEFTIPTGPGYYVDQNSLQIWMRTLNTTLWIDSSDSPCITPPSTIVSNSLVSTYNGHSSSHVIMDNATTVTITMTDCVGWSHSVQYNVVRKDTVLPLNTSNIVDGIQSGLNIYSLHNFSLIIGTFDPLPISLQCTTNMGSVNCSNLGSNHWNLTSSVSVPSGLIQINATDPLGNILLVDYSVFLDIQAPTCTIDGIERNSIFFVLDQQSVILHCQDNLTPISSISATDGQITRFALNPPTVQFDLSASSVWNITASDSLGNSRTYIVNFSGDSAPPVINCSVGSRVIGQDPLPINGPSTVYCEVSDSLATSSYYYLLNATQNSTIEGPFLGSFSFNIPDSSTGTNHQYSVNSTDSLGNEITRIVRVIFDKELPEIQFASFNNQLQNIPLSIADIDGAYQIIVIDTSFSHTTLYVQCQSGLQFSATEIRSEFELGELFPYQNGCGTHLLLTVDTFDTAGNSVSENFVLIIDYEVPTIQFSSDCYFDSQASVHYLLSPCSLFVSATDDSGQPVIIDEMYTNSHGVSLSSYPQNQSFSYTTTVTDIAGKITTAEIWIMIQPELHIAISSQTCNHAGVNCEGFDEWQFDMIIGSSSSLGIDVYNVVGSTPLTDVHGILCSPNPSIGCEGVESFPFNMQAPYDANYVLTVYATDALGRTTSANFDIVWDSTTPVLYSPPVFSPDYNSILDELVVCEVCQIEFIIVETHQPKISTNAQLFHISETSTSGYWLLTINLSSESFSNTDNTLDVNILSASNKAYSYSKGLILDSSIHYHVHTSNGPCLPAEIQTSENLDFDFICLYPDDSQGTTNLFIEPHSNIASSFSFDIEQSFLDSCPRIVHSQVFSSEEWGQISLCIYHNQPFNVWMNYTISIHSVFSGEPETVEISLFKDRNFQTELEFANESVVVSEDGTITFGTEITVNSYVVPGIKVDIEGATNGVQTDLANSFCRMWGERTIIEEDISRISSFDTGYQACGSMALSIERVSGTPIIMVNGTLDFSPHLSDSGHQLPLFLLRENPTIVIRFPRYPTNLYVDHSLNNIVIHRPESQQPYISLENCSYQGTTSVFLENMIDWSELANCIESIEDQDITQLVGLEFKFQTWENLDPINVQILCPLGHIPRNLFDWNNPQGCETTNADNFLLKRNHYSIELRMISCDLRCVLFKNSEPHAYEYIPDNEFFEDSSETSLEEKISEEKMILFGVIAAFVSLLTIVRAVNPGLFINWWEKIKRILVSIQNKIVSLSN